MVKTATVRTVLHRTTESRGKVVEEAPVVLQETPGNIRLAPVLRVEPVTFKILLSLPAGHLLLTVSSMEELDLSKMEPIQETPLFAEETEALAGVEPVPTEVEAEVGSPAVEADIFLAVIKAEVEVGLTTPEPIKTIRLERTKDMER
jgi:hypothetical protein